MAFDFRAIIAAVTAEVGGEAAARNENIMVAGAATLAVVVVALIALLLGMS